MKFLTLTVLLIIHISPAFSANSDGSGNEPNSSYGCTYLLWSNVGQAILGSGDGTGDNSRHSDDGKRNPSTNASGDGSGNVEADGDGSGNIYAYQSCMDYNV
jgi:hypothetical protein